ncbi:hypothetical protein APY03_1808 [Variovorax sp. WDL1]|nr:hypothetical protein APY03_1808 [Variovorax sp. WDL1]
MFDAGNDCLDVVDQSEPVLGKLSLTLLVMQTCQKRLHGKRRQPVNSAAKIRPHSECLLRRRCSVHAELHALAQLSRSQVHQQACEPI